MSSDEPPADGDDAATSAQREPDSWNPQLSDAVLLDAALDAFAEAGYSGTSVRQIARGLGVNHNHIPQRFGSKERLWYAAVDRGFRVIRHDLLSMFDESFTNDLSQIRAIFVRFVEMNSARPALLRIINQEAVLGGPRLEYLFTTYIEPVERLGNSILRKLEAQGAVRSNSSGLLYFFMTNGACGTAMFPGLASRLGVGIDSDDPESLHRHAVETVDLLFDGLLRPS